MVFCLHWNSVCNDDFLKDATAEPGSGWRAKYCMGGTCIHLSRPFCMEHLRTRSRRMNAANYQVPMSFKKPTQSYISAKDALSCQAIQLSRDHCQSEPVHCCATVVQTHEWSCADWCTLAMLVAHTHNKIVCACSDNTQAIDWYNPSYFCWSPAIRSKSRTLQGSM